MFPTADFPLSPVRSSMERQNNARLFCCSLICGHGTGLLFSPGCADVLTSRIFLGLLISDAGSPRGGLPVFSPLFFSDVFFLSGIPLPYLFFFSARGRSPVPLEVFRRPLFFFDGPRGPPLFPFTEFFKKGHNGLPLPPRPAELRAGFAGPQSGSTLPPNSPTFLFALF